VLDGLEIADGSAELDSFFGISGSHLQRGLGATDHLGTFRHCCFLESVFHCQPALFRLSQYVFLWYGYIVKDNFTLFVASQGCSPFLS
jgi:hypothetical protein